MNVLDNGDKVTVTKIDKAKMESKGEDPSERELV